MSQMFQPSKTERRVEAFVTTEEGRDAVIHLLRQAALDSNATVHTGTLQTMARLSGMTTFGDVMIAELGETSLDANIEAVRDIVADGTEVILLGRENDVATYRTFLTAGAKDYLLLPLDTKGPLPDLLSSESIPTEVKRAHGRVIAVCGVSGGVGASLLAANLSVACRAGGEGTPTVGLLDADLAFGSLAVDLDIETTSGLFEAFSTPERVDSTFLQATMHELQPGLSVYSAEIEDMSLLPSCEMGLSALVSSLKETFSTTVIDLPRRLIAEKNPVLDVVDDLILVLAPGFGAVRSAGRLMDLLNRNAAGDAPRVWLVLTQTRRDAGLSAKEVAGALDLPVSCALPPCASDIARAYVKGTPVQSLAPNSAYARRVARLAQTMCKGHEADKVRQTSWWKKRA
ncbi:pilus assembly protein CpaE [Celeribacter baekdonensis]|uniref:Pilus assembly protein CpaE n=1 Tax=Celeribacter baekdonensis TaxID=875171 RepID=A0A1G7R3J0_9RHOB|nr:cellulose synthase operon protein YhjQ/BcsQ [Celeribacter baekdonensis]SDG05333.1 pilus assembly protein CpaE [Celeribacter baekdonensis]